MGPVWEDADGEEIVNETFTRLEKAFHGRTNWGLLLKVEAIIVATTMIVAHLALHVVWTPLAYGLFLFGRI